MNKIVADEAIPWLDKLFLNHGEIHRYGGRELDLSEHKDAQALLIRSTVKITKDMLKDTAIKFVASATVGCDHVDQSALRELGIVFGHAPGCNANAVAEYVVSAIAWHESQGKIRFNKSNTAAVIGCGRIGSQVKDKLEQLNFEVWVNDPPLALKADENTQNWNFVSLNQALKADVICLHTPLTTSGDHPTYHLIGRGQLELINPHAILINAGRGAVVDNQALSAYLDKQPDLNVVLDVWENEPAIDWALLGKLNLASAHLAGHSWRGKVMGTVMIYEQACEFFGWNPTPIDEVNFKVPLTEMICTDETRLYEVVARCYDIAGETEELRKRTNGKSNEQAAQQFDHFRKSYHKRAEFSDLSCVFADDQIQNIAKSLGFNVQD